MTRRRRLDTLEVLTVDEVAAVLRVNKSTVYWLVRRGELRGVKVGSRWRVSRVALEEYLGRRSSRRRVSATAGATFADLVARWRVDGWTAGLFVDGFLERGYLEAIDGDRYVVTEAGREAARLLAELESELRA